MQASSKSLGKAKKIENKETRFHLNLVERNSSFIAIPTLELRWNKNDFINFHQKLYSLFNLQQR
jgi:hypothetical protein